ncbi:hypothetical protein [Shinella sp.]|jgi:hypothetical protein|uniref:hypothetical protein n=1 Tax=Shinella sp. TaxID=1870904 RepID=UPI003F71D1D8
MSTAVKISGATLDMTDPCAVWEALYATKLKRLANEQVASYSIKSPVTQEDVNFATASMDQLNKELRLLRDACEAKRTGRRQRFAMKTRIG